GRPVDAPGALPVARRSLRELCRLDQERRRAAGGGARRGDFRGRVALRRMAFGRQTSRHLPAGRSARIVAGAMVQNGLGPTRPAGQADDRKFGAKTRQPRPMASSGRRISEAGLGTLLLPESPARPPRRDLCSAAPASQPGAARGAMAGCPARAGRLLRHLPREQLRSRLAIRLGYRSPLSARLAGARAGGFPAAAAPRGFRHYQQSGKAEGRPLGTPFRKFTRLFRKPLPKGRGSDLIPDRKGEVPPKYEAAFAKRCTKLSMPPQKFTNLS